MRGKPGSEVLYGLSVYLTLMGGSRSRICRKTQQWSWSVPAGEGSEVIFGLAEGHGAAARDVTAVSQCLCVVRSLGCVLFGWWNMSLGCEMAQPG